jgi:molybdopterin/thiamine biosynthesis adenylyltransferase
MEMEVNSQTQPSSSSEPQISHPIPQTGTEPNNVVRTYDRQIDIFNPSDPRMQVPIVLIGAGTIGSWTALFLTKLGLNDITVFDPDIVENQNRANQLYGEESLGELKVRSLFFEIQHLSSIRIEDIKTQFPGEYSYPSTGHRVIVLVTVDSMKSRQQIFEWLQKEQMSVGLFIDARTGGEVGRVFAFEPMQPSLMEQYSHTLHSDTPDAEMNEEVRRSSEVKCTARSIVDVSVTVAARITNTVRKYLTNKEYPFETDIDLRNDIWIINK